MFIRDYSLNVMSECHDEFFNARLDPDDYDAAWLWCMGA